MNNIQSKPESPRPSGKLKHFYQMLLHSLRGQLFLAIAGLGFTVLTASLLGAFWIMEKSIFEIEERTKSSLTIASQLVSINAEAAILFNDQTMAKRLLSSLKNEPVVAAAIILNAQQQEMAIYSRSPIYRSHLLENNNITPDNIIRIKKKIFRQKEYIGDIIAIADIANIINQFLFQITTIFFGLLLLLLFLLTLLILFLNKFNRRITRLISFTEQFYHHQHPDNRINLSGKDELAEYSKHFNHMLDVIQLQTSELEVFNLQLAQQTLQDSTTGLPNQKHFKIKIKQLIAEHNDAPKAENSFSLITIDIDHFKFINNKHGHQTGDKIIHLFSEQLKLYSSNTIFFARIGGDKFVGLQANDPYGEKITSIYHEINKAFKETVKLHIAHSTPSCSAGIACMPDDASNLRDLQKASNIALYQAKRLGRDTIVSTKTHTKLYSSEARSRAKNYQEKTFDINRVSPIFQPIYNREKNMIGIECLATYLDKKGNITNARSFIPRLEEEGLISLLDYTMFDKSLAGSKTIINSHHQDLLVFHNFSLDTIGMPDFPIKIKSLLKKHSFNPKNFVLEVTETIQLNTTAIRHLKLINKLGCILCIDDFGAGFTHPGYFRKLPWGMVKIDKEYIRNINDPMNKKLVNALFRIARLTNIKIVAEGVEKAKEFNYLKAKDCDYYQGYYLSRPSTANKIAYQKTTPSSSITNNLISKQE